MLKTIMSKSLCKFPKNYDVLNKTSGTVLIHNRANLYQANQRQMEILKENQYLVQKIAAIQLKKNKSKKRPFRRYLSNLCNKAAKWNHEKIVGRSITLCFPIIPRTLYSKISHGNIKRNINAYITKFHRNFYCCAFFRINSLRI